MYRRTVIERLMERANEQLVYTRRFVGSYGLPLLATVAVLAAAAIVGLGGLHRLDHADMIVPALCSLNRWTIYYWGQDRIGMFLPLLAMPLKHPLHNLLFQSCLNTLAGWCAFFLVARAVVSDTRTSLAIGSVSLLGWLLLVPAAPLWDYLFAQPYGLSLSLAAAGMILLEPQTRLGSWRVAVAATALVLAFWTNLAVVVPLTPLLLHRAWRRGAPLFAAQLRSTSILLVTSALAFATGLLVSKLYTWVVFPTVEPTALGLLPPQEWPRALARLLSTVSENTSVSLLVFWGMLLVGGFFGLAWLSSDAVQKRAVLRASAALLMASGLSFAVAATSRHVGRNDFALRYAMPAMLLFALACATMAVRSWSIRAPVALRSAVTGLLLVAIPLGGWARFGPPSAEATRRDLQSRFGAEVADIEASGADLLLGGYWKVWPAVFLIQEDRFLSGVHRPFWGLAPRASATESDWRPLLQPGRLIAAFADDSRMAAETWRQLRLPLLSQVRRRGNVLVYEVVAESGTTPPGP